jgi:hypothetical protein
VWIWGGRAAWGFSFIQQDTEKREGRTHLMQVLAERDELEGAARFGFVMRVVIPPRGLGAQHTQLVLLLDPPAGVLDAQRGSGGGARAED